MERLTMTDGELNEIRQYCSDFNCPIKAEEDSVTQRFCDRVCDEFQGNCPFMNVGLKLKEYEDAEEQGLLLRLPCKVGDTVYTIPVRGKKEIVKKKIQNVEYRGIGYAEGQRFFINASATAYVESDIGKYMFFTREEAEQALKQMGE